MIINRPTQSSLSQNPSSRPLLRTQQTRLGRRKGPTRVRFRGRRVGGAEARGGGGAVFLRCVCVSVGEGRISIIRWRRSITLISVWIRLSCSLGKLPECSSAWWEEWSW
ncbi:hypothetical protein DY000_02000533 [Brassica cretica]|uniref:Uncharacterized protein n=1 Tax=Brassica cretica TaxID=69181 RepID=A0ABQ7CDN5_BRACR|nr:hypothetical protein DY000_02000533 [Brassica cretica]